jgi:hypothetical protein
MRFFVAAIIAAELGSTLALPTRLASEVNGLENTAFARRNNDVAALLNSIGLGQAKAGEQQEATKAEPAKEKALKKEPVAAAALKLEQEAAVKANEDALKIAEEAALKEAEAAKAKQEIAAPVEGEIKAGEGAEGKAAAGEEAEAGEDLVGVFDVATELQGGDLKQDVLFTKSVSIFPFQAHTIN